MSETVGAFSALYQATPNVPWKTWSPTELQPDVQKGDFVRKMGFQFVWSDLHKVGAELEPLRQIGDDLSDNAHDSMQLKPMDDSLARLLSSAEANPNGTEALLVKQLTTVPEWVDWEAITRGQGVFLTHVAAASMALLHLSLVGGFSAPKINKVLTATGYLANENTYRRLWETQQMIIDCLGEDSLRPLTGKGWKSIIRVRFLHTKVRRRLMTLQKWNKEQWGIPINQEDMAATLLSFQFNVLLAIDRLGLRLTRQELHDYTMLWRYIGYLMGVKDEYNPCISFEYSKAMMESIVMHIIEPDESSAHLANNVLRAVVEKPPMNWSMLAHAELSRFFLGDTWADALKLPRSSFYASLHRVNLLIMRFVSLLARGPYIGKYMQKQNLKALQRICDQGLEGKAATFHMTHAPEDTQIGVVNASVSSKSEAGFQSGWARKLRFLVLVVLFAYFLHRQRIAQSIMAAFMRPKLLTT